MPNLPQLHPRINNPLPMQPLPRVDAATPSVDLAEHDVPDDLEKVTWIEGPKNDPNTIYTYAYIFVFAPESC